MDRLGQRAILLLGVLTIVAWTPGVHAALKVGSQGPNVAAVQGYLVALGLLSGSPTGYFGPQTLEAVRTFQRQQGLTADGVVGSATLDRLRNSSVGGRSLTYRVSRGDTVYGLARRWGTTPGRIIALNELKRPDQLKLGQDLLVPGRGAATTGTPPRIGPAEVGGVELLPWTDAKRLLPNGGEARVTDVRTGRTFRIRRIQGSYHADSVPVSREDTAAVRAAYGGRWSWDRHPIIVEVAGRKIAASMNGYPHGTGQYARNSFPGHFCIHFYGSRTHGTGRVDPGHQAAIKAAARAGAVDRSSGATGGDGSEPAAAVAAPGPED